MPPRKRDNSDAIMRLRIHDTIMQTLVEKGWESAEKHITREKASELAYAVLQAMERNTFISPTKVEESAAVRTLKAVKEALGTDEDGEGLIEVARNAHRAEMKLSSIERMVTHEQE